jgi:hypothetical protein
VNLGTTVTVNSVKGAINLTPMAIQKLNWSQLNALLFYTFCMIFNSLPYSATIFTAFAYSTWWSFYSHNM